MAAVRGAVRHRATYQTVGCSSSHQHIFRHINKHIYARTHTPSTYWHVYTLISMKTRTSQPKTERDFSTFNHVFGCFGFDSSLSVCLYLSYIESSLKERQKEKVDRMVKKSQPAPAANTTGPFFLQWALRH